MIRTVSKLSICFRKQASSSAVHFSGASPATQMIAPVLKVFTSFPPSKCSRKKKALRVAWTRKAAPSLLGPSIDTFISAKMYRQSWAREKITSHFIRRSISSVGVVKVRNILDIPALSRLVSWAPQRLNLWIYFYANPKAGLLALGSAYFPRLPISFVRETVAFADFVPDHSGGTAPDFKEPGKNKIHDLTCLFARVRRCIRGYNP